MSHMPCEMVIRHHVAVAVYLFSPLNGYGGTLATFLTVLSIVYQDESITCKPNHNATTFSMGKAQPQKRHAAA